MATADENDDKVDRKNIIADRKKGRSRIISNPGSSLRNFWFGSKFDIYDFS